MARRPFSKHVRAQEERNGPSRADQGLFTAKPRSSHACYLAQVVQVKVDDQDLVRSIKVKCLGAVLDDGLTWREQISGGSVLVVWQN